MVIKVGINGFGRIGRVIFRTCLQNPDIELSAVNDPAIDIDYICYLIKFDSTHGKFKGNIAHTENEINIDDRIIKVFRDKLPRTVPWQLAGVQYVIEASGMFTCLEKSSGHLASEGVKRVILTAPSGDVPMIILGVNDNTLTAEQKVLSCASSTLYCLAPIVKVLEEHYGVTEGFITSIHAMTPSLKPLDGLCLRGKHWRDHRSIHQNIIPATTGSCKALAKIIPQVKDKLTGLAFRVPIVNVSVLDMSVRLDTATSLQDIIKTVEQASRTYLQNIIKISNEEAVSSDFSGDSHSCILDADSSLQLTPNFYKIICWYENEYSYACRVIDSIFFSERQFNKPIRLPCKMTYVRPKLTKKQDEVQQTEHNTKLIATIECNTEIAKTSTSAQETMCKRKPLMRAVVLRKPLSSHNSGIATTLPAVNRDTKKRNELFKIWNDNNDAQKNAVRQKRSTFFHSCMSLGPKQVENTDCMKAQQRLENVKREFSKMVNITEDLLKKSNSNKLQVGPATKSYLGDKFGVNGGAEESKTVLKFNNLPTNKSIFDVCGDYKNRLATKSTDGSNVEMRSCSCSQQNGNNSNNQVASTAKIPVKNNKPYLILSSAKTTNLANQDTVANFTSKVIAQSDLSAETSELSNGTLMNTNMYLTGQITKTDNISLDSLSKESPVQCNMEKNKEIIPKIPDNALKECVEENKIEVEITKAVKLPRVLSEKEEFKCQEPDPPKTIQEEFDKYLNKMDYNMRIIDEELQKRNIMLVNSQNQINSEVDLKSCMSGEKLTVENEMRPKKNNKQIIDTLNSKSLGSVEIVTEETSGCRSPNGTATSISTGNRARKSDLYDKLDSASATDSTNSFEINEKKSQVIQICDLTNSLEDLARLDKICRIIEISDELSDKLFSSLDQAKLTELKQKEWSFRDLCERIQLDDFCNKVFGKTRS